MIDIVGNIKIGQRLNYLYYSLLSMKFLYKEASILLNIEDYDTCGINTELIRKICIECPHIYIVGEKNLYGQIYSSLLNKCENQWILHFEEDHFCEANDFSKLKNLLLFAEESNADLIKASFFHVEHRSFDNINSTTDRDGIGKSYRMDNEVYIKTCEDELRYYIGNNCIWHKDFAKKYWGRDISSRGPHAFEIKDYQEDFCHTVVIPSFEILRSIDDDHGIKNSCIIKNPSKKWIDIYEQLDKI